MYSFENELNAKNSNGNVSENYENVKTIHSKMVISELEGFAEFKSQQNAQIDKIWKELNELKELFQCNKVDLNDIESKIKDRIQNIVSKVQDNNNNNAPFDSEEIEKKLMKRIESMYADGSKQMPQQDGLSNEPNPDQI